MEQKQKHSHYGHRQRMKDKIKQGLYETFKPHEVLEYLLTYTIPQKNTNDTAHLLLETFGSLSDVMDATYQDLLNVKGIGSETALFLTTLPKICASYQASKLDEKTHLTCVADCLKYFRSYRHIGKTEVMKIACVSAGNKLMRVFEVNNDSANSVNFEIRNLVEKILPTKTTGIIILHNHPDGSCTPSKADIEATKQIATACYALGITLLDHIIYNEKSHFSFGNTNLLNEIFDNLNEHMKPLFDNKKYNSGLNFNYK